MEVPRSTLLALPALLAIPISAQPNPRLAVEQFTLPNGLRAILHVDRTLPVVHVNTRYHVGASYERPGRTGFAHLFEHMLGEGVQPGTDFTAEAEKLGATEVSGSARHDFTELYETVPAGRLERILWLESERFARLATKATQETLDRQRDIVRNERREKIENRPYSRTDMLLHQHVYPPDHPQGRDILGSHADLAAATLEDIREFHRAYYTPANTVLLLAGDFDPAQARTWIEKHYGSIPAGPGVARPARWTPTLAAPKIVEVRERVPRERYFLGWPAPGQRHPDYAPLEIAQYILIGSGARLDHTNAGAGSGLVVGLDASIFVVHGAGESISLERAEAIVAEEIAKLARDGPTEIELTRARNNLEFRQLREAESLAGRAAAIHDALLIHDSPESAADWIGRHRNVTASQVREAVRRWIDTPNRVSIRVRPDIATASPASRQSLPPPPIQSERKFQPPPIRSARLPNGLEVFVVERRELPMVHVQLRMKLGAVLNPPGKEGLGLLTVTSLTRGTSRRDHAGFDRAMAGLAVKLGSGVDAESVWLEFDVISRSLRPALELVAEAVLQPTFPERRFEDDKKEWLDRAAGGDAKADDFHAALAAISFGRDHPWGRPATGRLASLRDIAAADARAFHARHYKPDAAALVFVGDVELNEATELARTLFGEWTGRSPAVPPVAAPQPVPGRVFLIERPGAAQTFIVQVFGRISRHGPRTPALTLADKGLGGMFSSRIMQKLRQEKGYAYWAGTSLWTPAAQGVWIATAPVQADKTREALAELIGEARAFTGSRPITAGELTTAKANATQGYASQFGSLSSIAALVAHTWATGRPLSELGTWPDALESVTLEAARAAASDAFAPPDRQVFLMTGDRAVVERAARELGLGEVVLISPDGSPRQP